MFARFLFIILALTCIRAAAQPDPAAILRAMSPERKVAQLFMVSFYTTHLTLDEAAFLRGTAPGAAVLFGRNVTDPAQVKALTASWQREVMAKGGPPMLIAADQEGGPIQSLHTGFTTFPTPMLWTAAADSALIREVGVALASELRAFGVNMNLAPVADLLTNRANPIIRRRSFGGAPERVNPAVAAFVEGMQSGGAIATAKHFPGHGDSANDSHLTLPRLDFDRARLDAVELQPFRAAIGAGVEAIMVGHLWMSAFDAEPLPASLSANIVTGLLRRDLGFAGIIMTDALDMDAIDTAYTLGEASIMALEAGVDLIAVGAHVGTDAIGRAIDSVLAAIESGRLSQARIDESAARILDLKAKYGILDLQSGANDLAASAPRYPTHEELTRRLFESGITVIDESDSIPLSGTTLILYPGTHPRIKSECERANLSQDFLALSQLPSEVEILEARRRAANADKIALFTLDFGADFDMRHLLESLPAEKTILAALVEPPPPDAMDRAAAAVMSYSPISPAIELVCQILHGERQAKGTFPFN